MRMMRRPFLSLISLALASLVAADYIVQLQYPPNSIVRYPDASWYAPGVPVNGVDRDSVQVLGCSPEDEEKIRQALAAVQQTAQSLSTAMTQSGRGTAMERALIDRAFNGAFSSPDEAANTRRLQFVFDVLRLMQAGVTINEANPSQRAPVRFLCAVISYEGKASAYTNQALIEIPPGDILNDAALTPKLTNCGAPPPNSLAANVAHEMAHLCGVWGREESYYLVDMVKLSPDDAILNGQNWAYLFQLFDTGCYKMLFTKTRKSSGRQGRTLNGQLDPANFNTSYAANNASNPANGTYAWPPPWNITTDPSPVPPYWISEVS